MTLLEELFKNFEDTFTDKATQREAFYCGVAATIEGILIGIAEGELMTVISRYISIDKEIKEFFTEHERTN
jgi:hypothetical protein